LRGRCRHCKLRIAWRYPAVEFATAALFLLSWLRFGLTVTGIGTAVLCFLLLGLAVMDAEIMRLPDAFTLPGIVLGIFYSGISIGVFRIFPQALILPTGIGIFSSQQRAPTALSLTFIGSAAALLWALLAALFLFLIRWLFFAIRHKQGLGLGDVKLFAMIAAWLGPAPAILTLLLGALAAALYGILAVALSRGRRPLLSTSLPLGSFLSAAALFTIFAGDPIIAWYLRFYGIGK
jgi:leader peptidase (prepilin peptidase)/N-methyltransferase